MMSIFLAGAALLAAATGFANWFGAEGMLTALAEIGAYLMATLWLLGQLLHVLVDPDQSGADDPF